MNRLFNRLFPLVLLMSSVTSISADEALSECIDKEEAMLVVSGCATQENSLLGASGAVLGEEKSAGIAQEDSLVLVSEGTTGEEKVVRLGKQDLRLEVPVSKKINRFDQLGSMVINHPRMASALVLAGIAVVKHPFAIPCTFAAGYLCGNEKSRTYFKDTLNEAEKEFLSSQMVGGVCQACTGVRARMSREFLVKNTGD